MKLFAIVLAAFAMTACAIPGVNAPQTAAQKEASEAQAFCKKPENKKTDLCSLYVNPRR